MSSDPRLSTAAPIEFTSARAARAFENVVSQIRSAIASEQLRPGDRLPSVKELQAQFQVSRAVVLEGLRVLEEIRLIEVRRGASGGVFVRPLDSAGIVEHLLVMTDTANVSVEELVEFRKVVEGQNAAWAAKVANASDIERLRVIAADVESFMADDETPWEAYLTRDAFFHVTVARAARNRVSLAVMDGLIASLNQLLFTVPPGHEERLLSDFRGVYEAIRAGRAQRARKIMEEHIEFFTSILLVSRDEIMPVPASRLSGKDR